MEENLSLCAIPVAKPTTPTLPQRTSTPSATESTTKASSSGTAGNLVVCYFTNWSQYRVGNGKFTGADIDAHLCTHIIVAFGLMTSNLVTYLEWNDNALYDQLRYHKASNPDLKILIAVGGWNAGSRAFQYVCQSEAMMSSFAKNVITFLRNENMDGFDLDWEYPTHVPDGKQKFTDLARILQDAFTQESVDTGKEKLLLTAATAAGITTIAQSYDLPKIAQSLDFLNLMAYDFHGAWEKVTGHNAGLFPAFPGDTLNVASSVDFYLDEGFPASKLVLGIGTYGRTWTLANSASTGVGASAPRPGTPRSFTKSAGYAAYFEICSVGWTRVFDDVQKVPYAFQGDQWVSYDDLESAQYKVDFIKQRGLAGAMFWEMGLDDFANVCGGGSFSFINSVKQGLAHES